MNHRERLIAALSHRQPDRVPIDIGGTVNSSIAMLFTLWASLFELRPNTSGKPKDFRSCVIKGSM